MKKLLGIFMVITFMACAGLVNAETRVDGVETGVGDITKVGTPADDQVGVWTGDGTIEGSAGLTYDGSNFQLTGDIGSTGARITKGWYVDLQVTNAIAGAVTGNAATATALETTRAIGGVNFDGTAAITPTTIVVADTADSTSYVGLWESATGNLLPKTDAGATYDASTGILTATGFSGPINGTIGATTPVAGVFTTVTTVPSALPAVELTDSDTTDEDTGVRFYGNATATGTGAEVYDWAIASQGAATAGTIGDVISWVGASKLMTFAGVQVSTVETVTCVSEAGTAAVTKAISLLVSDGDADTDEDTVALANGTAGQIKMFVYLTDTDTGDSVNVTPTTGLGFTKIVFDTVGEGCSMIYTASGWAIVSNNGGVIS